ncbi:hypothetical protein CHS0354_014972 [Potamilus streckersoni]|uniref:Uncharacterized protein n=1 Tax=Potamilus streckersoni TaxID=2493646 RepID=A0AAE0S2N8_9BIVA|nr:hypothetical protein CHS0354_014972 [Potamilus streckersoni]
MDTTGHQSTTYSEIKEKCPKSEYIIIPTQEETTISTSKWPSASIQTKTKKDKQSEGIALAARSNVPQAPHLPQINLQRRSNAGGTASYSTRTKSNQRRVQAARPAVPQTTTTSKSKAKEQRSFTTSIDFFSQKGNIPVPARFEVTALFQEESPPQQYNLGTSNWHEKTGPQNS